ncbi:MAG: xanthine dehydrogenase family protein subunit M [Anaerolineae bacterium]|nr:xanthine dehydrogenase family protein subunit M [Anaerolineae bacterium]
MWKRYFAVTSLAEALQLLAEYQTQARIIAGGTDLLIELERGQRPGVEVLVDVSRVPGLDHAWRHADEIRFGPLFTHNHAVASPFIVQEGLPLAQAAWEVGAPQIRNRGTIVGNLITASPANDTITPLMALDASLTLKSLRGERQLSLRDFYQGYRQTALQPDEMVTEVRFPALQSHEAGFFLKLGLRRAQAISVLNIAVVVGFEDPADRRSPLTRVSLALGCVAPTIIRLPEVEAQLLGQSLTEATPCPGSSRRHADSATHQRCPQYRPLSLGDGWCVPATRAANPVSGRRTPALPS